MISDQSSVISWEGFLDDVLVERVLEMAVGVQQVAAPTFAEGERAAFVQQRFAAEGLTEVSRDAVGNVYARLEGSGQARPLVVSAHLDTVFPAGTDLCLKHSAEKGGMHRISGPGIGDNSLGVAGLFGLLWGLRQREMRLPGDLWLAANVGEEGLGDLAGMKAVVERFGAEPLAYIILEGMSLGQVYHRGLGVQRYRITARTAGGHSWVDHGRRSAVHELAALIVGLKGLALPEQPRSSLNVGVVAGGTSVNTIAAEAHLELDLRSEAPQTLQALAAQVEAMVQAANHPGADFVEMRAEIIGQRPAGEIPAGHPLVRLAVKTLEAQGCTPRLNIGSTDANVPLSRGLPAICLGLTVGGGAHTVGEYILTEPVAQGLGQLLAVVKGAYQLDIKWARISSA